MSLRAQIILAVLAVVALLHVASVAYFVDRERALAVARLHDTIGENAQVLEAVTQVPLYDGDIAQLNTILNSIFANPDVTEIELKETRGDIALRRTRSESATQGEPIRREIAIRRGPDTLGSLRLAYTTANIERRLAQSRNALAWMSALVLALLAALIYLLAARLTRPIEQLTVAARSIAEGDLEREIDTAGAPPMATLASSFQRMRDAIRQKMSELEQTNLLLVGEIAERTRAEADMQVKDNAIATSANAIAIADAQERILYVNPAFVRLWGYGDEREVLGRGPAEFVADPADAKAGVDAAIQKGVYIGELRAKRKDSSLFSVELSASAVRDSSGALTHLMASFVDISVRKRQELELRRSEQRFKALVDLSSDWYWQTDTDHRFVFREGRILQQMGVAPQADYGKVRWEMPFLNMTEADWARHRATLDRREDFRDLLLERRSPDGRVFWASISGKPLFDEAGVFIGYHGTGRDITAQVEAEQALRESQARISSAYATLNDAIESAPAAIAIYDAQDRLMACNSRFRAFFSFDPELVRPGRRFRELVARFDESVKPTWPKREGTAWLDERTRLHLNPAEPIELELPGHQWLQIIETRTSEGGIVTVYNDITELKQRELDLRDLNEALEHKVEERTSELAAANRELESFASSVAHDLRAPLRGIDGFGKLLDDGIGSTLDPQSRGYLQRMRVSAQRMGRLIDDLLKFSRLGRSELRRQRVDLSAMAHSVAEELRRTAAERAVRWSIVDGLSAWGDPGLLYVVMQNLLGNAWKYSSKTADAAIEFGVNVDADGVRRFFVRDNGAGFDMSHAQMLFQPFRRLHGQHEFEGTGIGLATVRRIVERHGGEIRAEAEVGKGATFAFTLTEPV